MPVPDQPNSKRDEVLLAIEKKLGTRVIAYLTGDRQNLLAQIGADAIPLFRRHLEGIGEVQSISLFLYTRGGDTNVPWRLVTLLREYCATLKVLVPFRAHSAGTLICMGADEIVAGKMAELSAIDPSVANEFNPPNPMNPLTRIQISVEDVNAFKALAERFGVFKQRGTDERESDEEAARKAQVFLALASKVEPLALGNVERTHQLIRKIAADLLNLHPPTLDKPKVEKIIENLTVGMYSHQHMINRREAKSIGLNIKIADNETDGLLWSLFESYAAEMELDKVFNPAQLVAGQTPPLPIRVIRAIVESVGKTDVHMSEGTVSRMQPGVFPPGVQLPPQFQAQIQAQVAVQFSFEGWKRTR